MEEHSSLELLRSSRHQRLVMGLLAASLHGLDLVVLPLESTSVFLGSQNLVSERVESVLLGQSRAVKVCGAFDDCADLGEVGDLLAVLLVVPVGIEDIAHLEELLIAFTRSIEVGARKIVPHLPSVSFLSLKQMKSVAVKLVYGA